MTQVKIEISSDLTRESFERLRSPLDRLGEAGSTALKVLKALAEAVVHVEGATSMVRVLISSLPDGKPDWRVEAVFGNQDSTLNEELSLADLKLHKRLVKYLERAGILTIAQLLSHSEVSLANLPNIGRSSVAQINEALREFNLGLQES